MTKTPVQKIDDGDIRGRLEDVSTHTMIQIRPSMMPFFGNVWDKEGMENGRKALEGWNVKSNSNPLYPGRIAEMINHSAGFPLDRTDELYYTEFGNDTVAVQTHRSKKKMVRDKSNSQKNNHTHFLRYFLKYFSQKYQSRSQHSRKMLVSQLKHCVMMRPSQVLLQNCIQKPQQVQTRS